MQDPQNIFLPQYQQDYNANNYQQQYPVMMQQPQMMIVPVYPQNMNQQMDASMTGQFQDGSNAQFLPAGQQSYVQQPMQQPMQGQAVAYMPQPVQYVQQPVQYMPQPVQYVQQPQMQSGQQGVGYVQQPQMQMQTGQEQQTQQGGYIQQPFMMAQPAAGQVPGMVGMGMNQVPTLVYVS